MDVRRVRATVRGLVQGVSFRAATRAEARSLGVVGWVMNLPDGSVRLEAQGTAAQVEALLAWCQHGPPLADVSGVDVEELAPLTTPERELAIRH